MANDGKILDELHFLSWKIQSLEKKLETSLAIQEDLAASLLTEDSSSCSTSAIMASRKFDRRNVFGSSCSEPFSSDDDHDGEGFDGTAEDEGKELQRSYLIIPVGSYKDKESYTFPSEKQTFTWSEMDDNACKYISESALNGDKEIVNNPDVNDSDSNKSNLSNTPVSSTNRASPLSQNRASERQMCTQWNRNDSESETMNLEDCLLNSRGSHSIAYEPFEEQNRIAGAFDIEYDEDKKIISNEPNTTSSSSCRYGLTIGIATAKGSSQGTVLNGENSSREAPNRDDRYLGNSERLERGVKDGELKEQRAVTVQLRPLLQKSKAQSMYSSDEVTFDGICNDSSKSMYCDDVLTENKRGSNDQSPEISNYYKEKDKQLSFNEICVDSGSSEGDQTNYNFVDMYIQDVISSERNPVSLNANPDINTSPINMVSGKQRVLTDYPLLAKNGKYESNVYLTDRMKPYQKGTQHFVQDEINYDTEGKEVIKMQMIHMSRIQRDYGPDSKLIDDERPSALREHNGEKHSVARNHFMSRNVNMNSVSYGGNEAKPSSQYVNSHISQFADRVYGIIGYNNDYKTSDADSREATGGYKLQPKVSPNHPRFEQVVQSPDGRPHMNPRKDGLQTRETRSEMKLDDRGLCGDFQSKFPLDTDTLTESGFSETLLSAISDDVFFPATLNPHSENKPLSKPINLDRTSNIESSESESPYSSLTSVSSHSEQMYHGKLGSDSIHRLPGFEDRTRFVDPASPISFLEKKEKRSTVQTYIKDNDSTSDSENHMRSFRLSPLPRPVYAPTLHEHFLRDSDIIQREYAAGPRRVASPTSSVETSDLSMTDSICGCQYQCECQTGIPTVEDFREELKAISKYVLNARKESSSTYRKRREKYFLDEEQGEMGIFDRRLQMKENDAVPMLVRVILRLRKHFFGTIQSQPIYKVKNHHDGDINNNETSQEKQRSRRISFSPSAMLLSAIGENSAEEVREVIEKENIDVNQISPSGRSLLHKAAAAGDLESIHTLVQYGALVNIQDQDGFPPFHSALRKAHFKCAILLIEYGTDVGRYTSERVREFLEIKDMTRGHLPALLKTNL